MRIVRESSTEIDTTQSKETIDTDERRTENRTCDAQVRAGLLCPESRGSKRPMARNRVHKAVRSPETRTPSKHHLSPITYHLSPNDKRQHPITRADPKEQAHTHHTHTSNPITRAAEGNTAYRPSHTASHTAAAATVAVAFSQFLGDRASRSTPAPALAPACRHAPSHARGSHCTSHPRSTLPQRAAAAEGCVDVWAQRSPARRGPREGSTRVPGLVRGTSRLGRA